MVTVLYFAAVRERTGRSQEQLDLQGPTTVRSLLDLLSATHPTLASLLPHLRVAVNQEFASLDAPVPADAEVALIPPVAGGSGQFRVTDRPLSLQDVIAEVARPGAGGVVTFTGAVRNETKGRRVVKLDYEAYAPMAESKLAEIGAEISEKWPGSSVAIVHRVGTLVPGEAAVVIAVSAPHRKEAFLSCEHAIERLKQDVPIWKREYFEDGQVWVGLGP
ncbi:MAG: molybdopterin converting factor subunit 1 [Myxococcaceae bacterium]